MNRRKTRAMYESGLNTEISSIGSGYQATYEEFVHESAFNFDRKRPTAGLINVKNYLPCVEQI